ncbi:YcjX family protein, partial [Mesorhizobium sp. M8A.F.Ca.ET.021.01.1.1]
AAYLKACKLDERALSTLPPGRFLMPGDLEGSPALTFAPLAGLGDRRARNGSLHAMMERRYEAYKTHVVKPFFREHITRLDRQIVLIDAMQALNAGPGAMADLERAVTEILNCFRPGRGSFLTDLFSRRIDRILVAATKADHLHHESHDRLQAIVRRLADRAVARANFTGADVDVVAMAAVRATREGTVKQGRETLPVIIGTPIAGEKINGETFDGKTETAIFPGDLPEKIDAVFDLSGPDHRQDSTDPAIRFVRFRPPKLERTAEGVTLSLPHIRLDRALQFLIGDHLA